jgi:hypothetical protein
MPSEATQDAGPVHLLVELHVAGEQLRVEGGVRVGLLAVLAGLRGDDESHRDLLRFGWLYHRDERGRRDRQRAGKKNQRDPGRSAEV